MNPHFTFTEFIDKIVSEIKSYLPADYAEAEITISQSPKPGNQIFTGIAVKKPGCNMVPVVYLDEIYDDYSNGRISFPTIYTELEAVICQPYDINMDVGRALNWDVAKEHIISRLINIKNGLNTEYLKNRPCTRIANSNLGIIYEIDFSDSKQVMTSPITYDRMNLWGVSLEEINRIANQNNPRIRPVNIVHIDSMFSDLFLDIGMEDAELPQMYAVSNMHCSNGAIAITYDGVDKKLRSLLGDYYLLPSSVHELIAVGHIMDVKDLTEMIQDINREELQDCDILDDVPYIFRDGNLVAVPFAENPVHEVIPDCPILPVLT